MAFQKVAFQKVPAIDWQVEVGTLGRRIFERIAGLAGEKRVERVRGGVHRMRML